jgi:hypothetical protein
MTKNKKTRYAIFGAAAVLGTLLTPGVASAVTAEIVGFTYAGNGCPAGSVGWVYDNVNNKLTVNFDQFGTTMPPGVSTACNLTFVVKVPSAFQISLNRVEYLGYVDTESSVYGQLRRRYKYGDNPPLSLVKSFPYGDKGDYYLVDQFPGWSTCTDQVTVTTTARVDIRGNPSGTYTSEMIVDTLQYDTRVVFYFGLLPC